MTVVVASALATVVLTPAVVAVLAAWGRSWVPAGDWAMLELAVADTGTATTRLVGPYSRMGWSHPGPLLFWSLAPLWRATGGAAWSLLVGAALVNLAALVAVVVLAWRRGRLALLALVSMAFAWVVSSFDDGLLADPWNPWVGVLALAAVVLGVAGALEGDGPALVVAVVAGTLCAQSHVGFVPVVGALWLVGGVWAWRRARLSARWWGWGAAAPLVVLWSPVIVDAVVGRGNVWDLAGGVGADDPAGWRAGLELVARQLSWGGPWMGGGEPIAAVDDAVVGRPLTALVVPVVVFTVALGLGVWRRTGAAVRLQVVVAVAVVAGAVAMTRLDGPAFGYLVRWWWPLAALWWSSAAWTLWCVASDLVPAGRAVRRRPVGGPVPQSATPDATVSTPPLAGRLVVWAPVVLGVVALGVAGPLAVDAAKRVATHDSPNERFAGAVTGAVGATLAALGPPGGGEAGVVELWSAGEGTGWVVDAVSVALERAGWQVVVPRTAVAVGKWGMSRTAPGDELLWLGGSPVPPTDRRAVWVLGDGDRPAPGSPGTTVERVVDDAEGIDGAPFSVWVG